MNLHETIRQGKRLMHDNSPSILAGFGVAGVLVTGYFAVKGGKQAQRELENQPTDISFKEEIKLTWRCYVPAAISGAGTVACIIGATSVQARRTAAAVSAYTVTERAYHEYKERMREEIGEHKEQMIRDDMTREKVENDPPKAGQVFIAGGTALCCELYTGRYFESDIESIRRACNWVNMEVIHDLHVTISQFYDELGLPHTSTSDELGWDSDKFLELSFSSVLTPDGRPCLAFEYNYVKPI